MELVRVAMAHLGEGYDTSADRYLVHVVVNPAVNTAQRIDGTPLHPDTVGQVGCDATTVVHTVSMDGETLHLGRKTREWNTAQRRAVNVRDQGTCRYPGCTNHHVDLHHLHSWSDGGPTDLDNAASLCRRHHRLLHHGYTTTGTANGSLTFHRPNAGSEQEPIGTTHPRTHQPLLPI